MARIPRTLSSVSSLSAGWRAAPGACKGPLLLCLSLLLSGVCQSVQQHVPATPPQTAQGSFLVFSISKLIDGSSIFFPASHGHVFNTVTPSASVGSCYPELQLFVLLIHSSPFISFGGKVLSAAGYWALCLYSQHNAGDKGTACAPRSPRATGKTVESNRSDRQDGRGEGGQGPGCSVLAAAGAQLGVGRDVLRKLFLPSTNPLCSQEVSRTG